MAQSRPTYPSHPPKRMILSATVQSRRAASAKYFVGLRALGDVLIGTAISKEVAVFVQNRQPSGLPGHDYHFSCYVQIGEGAELPPAGKYFEGRRLRLLTRFRGKQIVEMNSPHDFIGRVPQNLLNHRAGITELFDGGKEGGKIASGASAGKNI